MKHFGWNVEHHNYEEFFFEPKVLKASPVGGGLEGAYTVEGDWSGAAFLLVAGAITGEITVEGLDINSAQADKEILSALNLAGAKISVNDDKIIIAPTALTSFNFDATDCPDLFPPLVSLAANCNGTTSIKGVTRLKHKESNRAKSLQEEFKKMGVEIEISGDDMLIMGNENLNGAIVQSHHDHRIAMACAVAALKAKGETTIENAEAINKSYPDFYDHLQKLNAKVSKA
jgi:3-phosphoshikimate 1-carboxyvinyltransferase